MSISDLEKKITDTYATAYSEMKEKFEAYMKTFDKADKKKRQQLAAGLITNQEYINWRQGQIAIGHRWSQMVRQMAVELANANQTAIAYANDTLPDVYATWRNKEAFSIKKKVAGYSFTLVDANTVKYLMLTDTLLLPTRQLNMDKAVDWNIKQINSQVLQGIIQGESNDQIAKRLRNVSNMGAKQAIRTARTMTTSAENKGRVDSLTTAQERGIITKKEWLATGDSHTRDSHLQVSGTRVDPDGYFNVGGAQMRFPADPMAPGREVYNCRCTLKTIVIGFRGKDGKVVSHDWDKYNQYNGDTNSSRVSTEIGRRTAAAPIAQSQSSQNVDNRSSVMATVEQVAQQTPAAMILQSLADNPEINEKRITEAGKIAYDALKTQFHEKEVELARAKREVDTILNKINSLRDELDKNIVIDLNDVIATLSSVPEDTDEIKALRKLYREKQRLLDNLNDEYQEFRKNAFGDILSKVRPTGYGQLDADSLFDSVICDDTTKREVKNAWKKYPTSWIEAAKDRKGTLKTGTATRGSYNSVTNTIEMNPQSKKAPEATATHELGHLATYVVPNLSTLERDFYNRRTAGDVLEPLGFPYDPNEMTRKDNFIDSYMGKDYGGRSLEICSMGFELALTNPKALMEDEDMAKVIFGMLLGV